MRPSTKSPIIGSWKGDFVVYNGEKIDAASNEQASDYTLNIDSKQVHGSFYGTELSGTWEYKNSDVLEDGQEVLGYILTTDSGAKFCFDYYKKYDAIAFDTSGNASVDPDNCVSFIRE